MMRAFGAAMRARESQIVKALTAVLLLGSMACWPSRGADGSADSVAAILRVEPADRTELTLSVRELGEKPGWGRRRVRVTGVCVGYVAAGDAATPPITRSDWVLEADDAQVFVSGPFPDGCTATTRGTRPVTIVGEVAEDTLPVFGDRPATPRRFLLRIR